MVRVVLPVVTVSYVLLLLRVLLQITTCAALSTPSSSSSPRSNTNNLFTEIQPLKAAMLTKTWQGLMLDVEEKVGVVPELGKTSVSIRRSSTVQMPRRHLCKQQFLYMYETSFALALADKASSTSDERMKKRETIAALVLEDHRVGPQCFTYASLTQPSALVLVVKQQPQPQQQPPQPQPENATNISHHPKRKAAVVVWSILALTVNPTERNLEAIVEAERTVLHELYNCCCREVPEQKKDDNDADADNNTNQNNTTAITVRIIGKARNTLAGTNQQLGLHPVPLPTTTAAATATGEASTSTPTTAIPTPSSSASGDNPNTQYAAAKAVDFDEDKTVKQQMKDETQQQQQKQQPDQDQQTQSINWFQFIG